ncbi:MAG: ATP-binding protein [Acidimicrobiales bacterium]
MSTTGLADSYPLPRSPGRARRAMRSLLGSAGWQGDVEGVVLAVHEAVMNAEQHAGGCISATAHVDDREVVVEVCDRGAGFNPHWYTGHPPNTLAERGRGIWLISQIAARYEFERRGGSNCFRLCFHP